MYFYRHHPWGAGVRFVLVLLLIFGSITIVRSSMQMAYLRGVNAGGAELTGPIFVNPGKWGASPTGPLGLTPGWILVIFLGGILLIKLVKFIVGLILFNRWKKEGGFDSGTPWHPAADCPHPPYVPFMGGWGRAHRYWRHHPHRGSQAPEPGEQDPFEEQEA